MELVLILIPIFVFVLLKMVLDHRAAARADNVRLLEEALKSPSVDRATLESLTYQLTGHHAPRHAAPGRLPAVVLAIGWLAMFVGIGLWIAASLEHDGDLLVGGIITAVIGFGFVTYPFALRELEARRQPQ
jgi:hypothetical protein